MRSVTDAIRFVLRGWLGDYERQLLFVFRLLPVIFLIFMLTLREERRCEWKPDRHSYRIEVVMIAEAFLMGITVWYVPGWMRTQVPQEGVMPALSNAFPKAEKSVQGVGNIHRAEGELP